MLEVTIKKVSNNNTFAMRSYTVDAAIERDVPVYVKTPKGSFFMSPNQLRNKLGESPPLQSKINKKQFYKLYDYKIPMSKKIKYVCIKSYPGMDKGSVIEKVKDDIYKIVYPQKEDENIEETVKIPDIDHFEDYWKASQNVVVRIGKDQYIVIGNNITIVEI